MTGISEFKF